MKNFSDLTEQELLALAIALEEEDSRTYSDLAEAMRESYPGTARMFAAMAEEEDGHRHRLLGLEKVRAQAELMEAESKRFYKRRRARLRDRHRDRQRIRRHNGLRGLFPTAAG